MPYWLQGAAGVGIPFAEAVTMQKCVADASRGPKRLTDPDFLGPMNYAYHFDAVRFAAMLGEHARSLGVKHIFANVNFARIWKPAHILFSYKTPSISNSKIVQ